MSRSKDSTYPTSVYDAANSLIVSRENLAVPLTVVQYDIQHLLSSFLASPHHTFQDFDHVWNQLQFEHIHFGCFFREARPMFMNTLYTSTADFFCCNVDAMKFGVIYALYFLFCSQPSIWGKEYIRVTQERWTMMFDFYLVCAKDGRKEYAQAAVLFKRLKDELCAFVFVANETLQMGSVFEIQEKERAVMLLDSIQDTQKSILQDDVTATCNNDIMAKIKQLNDKYQQLKAEACASPQATLATQQWVKQTANGNQTNQRHLQRTMVRNLTLYQDRAYASFNAVSQRLWKERVDRGLEDIDTLVRGPLEEDMLDPAP
ncbi:hypothetical protein DM01DRAFT_304243 [Hesseltinella vesiculosa]|uniref:Uncharacterized protein n=1 Tax=Hesseltinella vesiculosa TaxID=101127 RepID=A0A1X2GL62_9FUNG|nr:hypothetical protein DM01DRAFT_304243 [Hesseltinella vesiculosa]